MVPILGQNYWLYGITLFVLKWNIVTLQVPKHLQVILDWAAGAKFQFQVNMLEFWKFRKLEFQSQLQVLSYTHVYRQYNSRADLLSQTAIRATEGL